MKVEFMVNNIVNNLIPSDKEGVYYLHEDQVEYLHEILKQYNQEVEFNKKVYALQNNMNDLLRRCIEKDLKIIELQTKLDAIKSLVEE
jgi:predicted RNase H-like nuclease (RuvC/YqgF family)